MNIMPNPSFFLSFLTWTKANNIYKSSSSIPTTCPETCSSYDLVYINNCPLWRAFRRLFSWLLMRRSLLYILIWNMYEFFLLLLFIPWKYMAYNMFECISSENASALNYISPSLRSEDHVSNETTQHNTPSAILTRFSTKLKAFFSFFSP